MRRDELINAIAKLVYQYEEETDNKVIVGAYLHFSDSSEIHEWSGEVFTTFVGSLSKNIDEES